MLGERLKSLRKERKLTQEELGRKVNVTKVSISGYENGNRSPDTETLQKLADFFEVTTDYLLGRTEEMTYKGIPIPEADREMLDFFNDPETGLFFKEMKEAPKDQLEEMRQIWEVLKRRGLK